jgi:hypothetical protein
VQQNTSFNDLVGEQQHRLRDGQPVRNKVSQPPMPRRMPLPMMIVALWVIGTLRESNRGQKLGTRTAPSFDS